MLLVGMSIFIILRFGRKFFLFGPGCGLYCERIHASHTFFLGYTEFCWKTFFFFFHATVVHSFHHNRCVSLTFIRSLFFCTFFYSHLFCSYFVPEPDVVSVFINSQHTIIAQLKQSHHINMHVFRFSNNSTQAQASWFAFWCHSCFWINNASFNIRILTKQTRYSEFIIFRKKKFKNLRFEIYAKHFFKQRIISVILIWYGQIVSFCISRICSVKFFKIWVWMEYVAERYSRFHHIEK